MTTVDTVLESLDSILHDTVNYLKIKISTYTKIFIVLEISVICVKNDILS